MRPPLLRLNLDPRELIVDNFAGGGGASTGIERATGRSPDIAVNHDPIALAMHAANHPKTEHLREDVWDRAAAECIDWSIPVPSIFGRSRPLAENTLRRIAHGVVRYVLNNPRPFVVPAGPEHGAPFIANTRNGERKGQTPRTFPLGVPYPTITAKGSQGALVMAFLAKHYGGVVGQPLDTTIGTVTTTDHHSLVTTQLGLPLEQRDHSDDVRALLVKFYGTATGRPLQLPLDTVTTVDRFGLVTVRGMPIVDIGMRMLQPRELFRAQGFGDDYAIDVPHPTLERTLTKTEQVHLCGNSVAPHAAEALVAANLTAPMRVAEVA